MSGEREREEALGRLADELSELLAAGVSVDEPALAARYQLEVGVVAQVRAAVELARGPLVSGELLGEMPELVAPALPPRYEVTGELGRGGMGVVYRARQVELGREVAIKVLRPGELLFGEAIERFRREAKSLARLRHPNIVRVYEVGEADGLTWFSMDLCEGGSLEDLLKAGALSPSHAVRLMKQVASAVAYTHSKSLIHRDLKPANVLLDEEGGAQVADFGLARELVGEGDLTQSGALIGTPDYMAPEQARGDSGQVGEVTDVYALGVLLYECLAGRPPFAGLALIERIHAVVHADPKPPRKHNAKVPRELELVCLKAMAKEPERRYSTARAFLEELERFEEGRSVLAVPPSLGYRLRRFGARHSRELALLPLTLAVVGLVWWFGIRPQMGATPDALAAKATELLAVGDAERAAVLLELGADDGEAAERPRLEQLAASARVEAARQYERAGELAAALQGLRAGLAQDPHSAEARRALEWERARLVLAEGAPTAGVELTQALSAWLDSHSREVRYEVIEERVRAAFEVRGLSGRGLCAALVSVALTREELGPLVLERLAAMKPAGPAALVEALGLKPSLLAQHEDTLDQLVQASSQWRATPGLPRALGELLLSPGLSSELRERVALALEAATQMPLLRQGPHAHAADVEMLWRLWTQGSRTDGLRAWIDWAFARYEAPEISQEERGRLAEWLRTHTGLESELISSKLWLGEAQREPLAQLTSSLGLPAEPSVQEALEAFDSDERIVRRRAHLVLSMLAPAERPLPGWSEGSGLRAAWRRTFSSMLPGPRSARIAHLAFDRRSLRGLVLWEQRVEIEAAEHVHLKREALIKRSAEILPSISLPGTGSQSSDYEQYRCTTQFDLMRAPGVGHEILASRHSDHRLSPASPEHYLDDGPSAGPGEVRIVQRAFHDGLVATTQTVLHLTLAIFEDEATDERAWELLDWQEAVRADLLRVAADPATLGSASAARELGALALLLGKQSELPTLARLDAAAMALPEDPLPAFLPARALLGDQAVNHEDGIVGSIDALYSGLPRLRREGRWFWSRAILQEFGTQGAVAAQAYERWVARSWVSRPDLRNGHYFMCLAYLLIGVFLVVLTARRLLARRPVLLLAPLLVSFGLGLVCLRLGRGGVDLAPDALGFALAGLGVYWLARRLPGRVSRVAPSLFALAFLAELLSCAAPSSWYANCFAGLCGLASLLGLPYLVAALYRSAQLSPRERSYLRPGTKALLYYAGAGVLLYLMAIGASVSMDVVVMRAPRAMPLPIFTLFLCHLPLARALWLLDHATRCQFGLQRTRLPRERRSPEHALRAAGARR